MLWEKLSKGGGGRIVPRELSLELGLARQWGGAFQ